MHSGGRYGLLTLFLVAAHIARPLSAAAGLRGEIFATFWSLLPLAVLWSLARTSGHLRKIVGLSVPFLLAIWIDELGFGWAATVALIFISLYYGAIIVMIFEDLFRAEEVDRNEIWGAVSAYLLLGTLFAILYLIVEDIQPGSFHSNGSPIDAEEIFYFSYVTLATLGYGDVVPVMPLSKALSTLQAMVGTLYVAVIVARFVAMSMVTKQNRVAMNIPKPLPPLPPQASEESPRTE